MLPELDSIYQTAPIGLAVLDTDLRFVRINERLAEINGLPVEAHIGRSVRDVLPGLADQAEAVLRRVLSAGEAVRDVEIRGETPAQPGVQRIWVEQFTPLRDERGLVRGVSVVAQEVTEQRRAELSLRLSEENLAMAMEAAGLALWDWHIPTNRVRFGANWERLLGYPGDSFATSRPQWHTLIHPDDLLRTNTAIEAHVAGQSPVYECEYRVRHAGGRWVWLQSRGRVVERDPEGRPVRMIGAARDVSAQHKAREGLEQQARLLQLAFDAIFTWSVGHGIEFWNRGAELQYGFTADEARGVPPEVLLHTVFPGSKQEVDDALATRGVWQGELSHLTKDGRRLVVAVVLQRVAYGHEAVLEITRDVTAAKASEARLVEHERELRRSQERLQVALEAGRMGVWDWIPASGPSYWSPELYRLLGLPEDVGTDMHAFLRMVHPGDRPAVDAEFARVLAKGGDYETEFRIARADGQLRWLVSRGRVSNDGEDRPPRLVSVNFDITERKQVEQELKEADSRRTEFLAMLAHELRNPLAPITNAVRLLEKHGESPERREAATQILRRQTAHMARLVDDLLEVSRITQGRIELRAENVLLATSVFQAVEAARGQARERQQTLTVDVPPDLDLVADPARLTQIVSNLVTNAVKYTPEGGRIHVSAEAEPNDRLSIVVQDNGQGISAELLPRIFDLFTQDRRTLDRSLGGLGIGLSLVKRLAELHGGQVRCESAGPGTGARFVVCLPRLGRRKTLRSSSRAAVPARIAPLPILVVDDNLDAAQTLQMLLQLDGHRVELAHDGEEALSKAAAFAPRVVLLDIGLPKLDGLQVARRLRQEPRFERTVLVAMSGYAQASDRAATAAAGFDAHLAKPADLENVYRVIEQALGQ